MICARCGHEITKFDNEYLHVFRGNGKITLTKMCIQSVSDYDNCRCPEATPEVEKE